jgi:hypothetical protein
MDAKASPFRFRPCGRGTKEANEAKGTAHPQIGHRDTVLEGRSEIQAYARTRVCP